MGIIDRYTILNESIVNKADLEFWRYFDSSVFELPRLRNSYIMGCPLVCGDNPRALARGLSYVQLDTHGITFFIPPTSV